MLCQAVPSLCSDLINVGSVAQIKTQQEEHCHCLSLQGDEFIASLCFLIIEENDPHIQAFAFGELMENLIRN